MKPPPLQRHVARFEERNDFASAVLGAGRLARVYAELVEQKARDREPYAAGPPAESAYLLLGLYSVARAVNELTDAWTLPGAGDEPVPTAPTRTPVGLLR